MYVCMYDNRLRLNGRVFLTGCHVAMVTLLKDDHNLFTNG